MKALEEGEGQVLAKLAMASLEQWVAMSDRLAIDAVNRCSTREELHFVLDKLLDHLQASRTEVDATLAVQHEQAQRRRAADPRVN